MYPRIGAQRPGQLAVADIDRDHLGRTAVEKDLDTLFQSAAPVP